MRIAVIATIGLVAGCVERAMPEPSEGAGLYRDHCAACHGVGGRGDAPGAVRMRPQPPALTMLARDNGGAFPVNRVLSQIDGYTRFHTPGAAMPEYGSILRGPQVPVETDDGRVTPAPRPLAAILEYLRSIQTDA